MALIRVYSRIDNKHKIVLSNGIRKALDIKHGDTLELTVVGMNKPSAFLRVNKFSQRADQVVKKSMPLLRSIEKLRDKAKDMFLIKRRGRYEQ